MILNAYLQVLLYLSTHLIIVYVHIYNLKDTLAKCVTKFRIQKKEYLKLI